MHLQSKIAMTSTSKSQPAMKSTPKSQNNHDIQVQKLK